MWQQIPLAAPKYTEYILFKFPQVFSTLVSPDRRACNLHLDWLKRHTDSNSTFSVPFPYSQMFSIHHVLTELLKLQLFSGSSSLSLSSLISKWIYGCLHCDILRKRHHTETHEQDVSFQTQNKSG